MQANEWEASNIFNMMRHERANTNMYQVRQKSSPLTLFAVFSATA